MSLESFAHRTSPPLRTTYTAASLPLLRGRRTSSMTPSSMSAWRAAGGFMESLAQHAGQGRTGPHSRITGPRRRSPPTPLFPAHESLPGPNIAIDSLRSRASRMRRRLREAISALRLFASSAPLMIVTPWDDSCGDCSQASADRAGLGYAPRMNRLLPLIFALAGLVLALSPAVARDRKSTRLNSSH